MAMAYFSAIRVAAVVSIGVRRAIASLGLAVRVAVVLLVVLRHCAQSVMGLGAWVSEGRSGVRRQTRKLREAGADRAQSGC